MTGTSIDFAAIRTVILKDVTAVKRSKAITLPMILVPLILIVVLPIAIGLFARNASSDQIQNALSSPVVTRIVEPITKLPEQEQLVVLILGYLLSPLLLVIPLMVSAVLAADAFAGEKERRTLETLLHLPITDRDLFFAKILGSFLPAVAITWIGAVLYCVIADVIAWPVTHRAFLPFAQFTVMIIWIAPAVALLSLGLLVVVSSRARTTQEANQLGGAVILPLIFLAAAQTSTVLLMPVGVVFGFGLVIWVAGLGLVWVNGRRFTRDRLASAG